jgi:hypothetical protein
MRPLIMLTALLAGRHACADARLRFPKTRWWPPGSLRRGHSVPRADHPARACLPNLAVARPLVELDRRP